MKTFALAAALAVAAVAAPAYAQDEHMGHHMPAAASDTPAAAPAMAKISVDTTPIGDIIKNEKAKAALETAVPQIPQFYDQIATMTLAQVAPLSQGALDDAKLRALQAEFDKLQ